MAKILKAITLHNYRGLRNAAYSTAISIKNIKNLLMLVGKNDIGKSSILEALDTFFNTGVIKDTDFCQTNNATKLSIKCKINGNRYELESDKMTNRVIYTQNGIPFSGRDSFKNHIHSIHYTLFRADNIRVTRYKQLNVESLISIIKSGKSYKNYCINNFAEKPISKLVNNTLEIAEAFRKLNVFFQSDDMEGYYYDLNVNKDFSKLKKNKRSLLSKIRKFHFSDYQIENEKYSLLLTLFEKESIYNRLIAPITISIKVDPNSAHYKKFREWFIIPLLENITVKNIDKHIVNEYEKEQMRILKPLNEIENVIYDFKDNSNSIEKRGSGVQRLCAFYQFAINHKTSISVQGDKFILAVEEPEISLHPSLQRKFIQQLLDISQNTDTQVIITTHSPYIVNELEAENVCILKQITQKDVKGNSIKLISTKEMDKRIITSYPSMAEINYLAFDEPSITYHQELYGQIEVECMGESNGNKIGDIIDTIWKGDNTVWSTLISEYNCIPNRPFEIKVKNDFSSPDNDGKDKNGKTLYYYVPYCVRNSIDHPGDMNEQWKNNIPVVDLSIKMLIKIYRAVEKAEYLFRTTINSTSTNLDKYGYDTFKCSGASDNNEHSLVYWVKYQIDHPNECLIRQNRRGQDNPNGEIKNKINFVKAMYDIDSDWLTK